MLTHVCRQAGGAMRAAVQVQVQVHAWRAQRCMHAAWQVRVGARAAAAHRAACMHAGVCMHARMASSN